MKIVHSCCAHHGMGNINMLHGSVGNMAASFMLMPMREEPVHRTLLASRTPRRRATIRMLHSTHYNFFSHEMPLCDASYHPDPSSHDVAASTAVLLLMPIASVAPPRPAARPPGRFQLGMTRLGMARRHGSACRLAARRRSRRNLAHWRQRSHAGCRNRSPQAPSWASRAAGPP